MQELNHLLALVDAHFGGSSWFVFLLLGTGLFFTIYLRFPQLRFFCHAFNVVRGKSDRQQDRGDTSHFQALATALSGITVALMTLPNLIGILLLRKEVKKLVGEYDEKMKKNANL